jgi:hypothetical protein
MANPSTSLTTLRPELGSMLEFDLAANRAKYIADRVAPVMEVAKQSGTFGKVSIEQLLQAAIETKRAPGTPYPRNKFTFTSATYACEEHGAEEVVDDREAEMYREYLEAEFIATQRALTAVLQNREIRWSSAIFNASTWTGAALTTGVTNEWDDFANATPVTDVFNAKNKVYTGCGFEPNALIINRSVFENLRMCAEVIDRIESAGAGAPSDPGNIGAAQLAQVFGLPYIIVGGGLKNTANEADAVSMSAIWSNEYAMICRVATSNDMREPCIARTFHWGADGSSVGGTVESYRDETVRGEIIRVRHDVDEIVMYTEAGHLLSNITT